MNGKTKENDGLETVFEKYAALHLQQSSEMNKRIDLLVDNMGSMAEKMGGLIEVVAKSEERHNSHSEKSDRIEKVQIEQGKEFKKYRNHNDDRVMAVEKQVLLLDVNDKRVENRFSVADKRNATIITALIIAAILAFLGLK